MSEETQNNAEILNTLRGQLGDDNEAGLIQIEVYDEDSIEDDMNKPMDDFTPKCNGVDVSCFIDKDTFNIPIKIKQSIIISIDEGITENGTFLISNVIELLSWGFSYKYVSEIKDYILTLLEYIKVPIEYDHTYESYIESIREVRLGVFTSRLIPITYNGVDLFNFTSLYFSDVAMGYLADAIKLALPKIRDEVRGDDIEQYIKYSDVVEVAELNVDDTDSIVSYLLDILTYVGVIIESDDCTVYKHEIKNNPIDILESLFEPLPELIEGEDVLQSLKEAFAIEFSKKSIPLTFRGVDLLNLTAYQFIDIDISCWVVCRVLKEVLDHCEYCKVDYSRIIKAISNVTTAPSHVKLLEQFITDMCSITQVKIEYGAVEAEYTPGPPEVEEILMRASKRIADKIALDETPPTTQTPDTVVVNAEQDAIDARNDRSLIREELAKYPQVYGYDLPVFTNWLATLVDQTDQKRFSRALMYLKCLLANKKTGEQVEAINTIITYDPDRTGDEVLDFVRYIEVQVNEALGLDLKAIYKSKQAHENLTKYKSA